MSKTILILAPGFEEIEALTVVDVLRRAEIDLKTAGVADIEVEGSHGIIVKADMLLADVELPETIILPGGMPGSVNLSGSEAVEKLVCAVNDNGGLVASICAAPALALGAFGVLEDKTATCYPGFENNFPPSVNVSTDDVVEDGNIITSRGVGTSLEFSLALVTRLVGQEVSDKLRKTMLVK